VARLPLHHWHAAHGARFGESQGWQLPAYYASVEDELAAARTGLALADVSASAKISLCGQGVSDLTKAILADGPATKPRGVARLAATGSGWACRLTVDHLLLLVLTPIPTGLEECLARTSPSQGVIQTDVTSAYAGFCLVGPPREKLLRQLTPLEASAAALPVGTCAETSLAGVQALLVPWSEPSLSGMLIFVSWDTAQYVWETLMEAGHPLGITPLGLEGLGSLLPIR
jgi:sarcosine oxidase subunit alpha